MDDIQRLIVSQIDKEPAYTLERMESLDLHSLGLSSGE